MDINTQSPMPHPEHDDEGKMAKADLYKTAKYSLKLFKMMQDDAQLEGWVQAKITKAADYLASVYHYLEYEMKFTDYGRSIEDSEMYSESEKKILRNKLFEAKEKVKALKKAQAEKLKAKEKKKVDESEDERGGDDDTPSDFNKITTSSGHTRHSRKSSRTKADHELHGDVPVTSLHPDHDERAAKFLAKQVHGRKVSPMDQLTKRKGMTDLDETKTSRKRINEFDIKAMQGGPGDFEISAIGNPEIEAILKQMKPSDYIERNKFKTEFPTANAWYQKTGSDFSRMQNAAIIADRNDQYNYMMRWNRDHNNLSVAQWLQKAKNKLGSALTGKPEQKVDYSARRAASGLGSGNAVNEKDPPEEFDMGKWPNSLGDAFKDINSPIKNPMDRMWEAKASKKAKKDYDGDGKVETGKDEVIGSRRKAAGLPFKEGAKPDFLDMDKDGNKKEPMKKAVASKKVKEAAEKKCNHTAKGKNCPVHGMKECSGMMEAKPSAGMSKGEKSAVAKKAQAGKDIGKPGKSFNKVAKAAGGGEKGTKIAAAAMWKNQAK